MHEYSIVQALLEQCERFAAENDADRVLRVSIKIGVLSGVEPDLLETAFEAFKAETVCADAILEINHQPVVLHCRSCGKDSTIHEMVAECRECGSKDVSIVDGEEMYLMSLEME